MSGLEFYLDAFRDLSTCRPGGMDIRPIPFTAIAEYFRIYELVDFDEFSDVIRRLDNAFLELAAASSKNEGGSNASGDTNKNDNNKG